VKCAVRRCGDPMVKRLVQLSVLCAAAAACNPLHDDNPARVTIDVRCGTNADCPSGFVCEAETEHGPPTTMCESDDPAAICPDDYETHVGHGQIFCVPRLGVEAHNGAPISRAARLSRESSAQVDPPRAATARPSR
jgi:Cys-rich repeat protein